jgi:cellulose biosynthesis protein BcsQ
MATFFVDGDKGGVGKSFVARALADYLLTSGHCRKLVVGLSPVKPEHA